MNKRFKSFTYASVAMAALAGAPLASVVVNTAVVANEVTGSMTVNPVSAGSTILSGTGVANDNLSIQDLTNRGKYYSAVVAADGTWSVSVDSTVEGQKFLVTSNSLPSTSSTKNVPVTVSAAQNTTPETTVVFDVYDVSAGSAVVSGKGAAGERVSVVAQLPNNTTKSYSSVVDAQGNWSVSVDPAEAGTTFTAVGSVTQTYVSKSVDGVTSTPETPEVKASFDVFDVKAGAKVLAGKATPNESVYVVAQLPDKTTKAYNTVADADGNWSVVIDDAEVGTVYTAIGSVTQTYVSKAVDGLKPEPNVPASSNEKDASSKSSSKQSSNGTKASGKDAKNASSAKSSAKQGQKVLPNTAAVK